MTDLNSISWFNHVNSGSHFSFSLSPDLYLYLYGRNKLHNYHAEQLTFNNDNRTNISDPCFLPLNICWLIYISIIGTLYELLYSLNNWYNFTCQISQIYSICCNMLKMHFAGYLRSWKSNWKRCHRIFSSNQTCFSGKIYLFM